MGWLRQLFTRRRGYNELSQSLREHLEEKIADLTDHGMTRKEAEQTARREFGNLMLIEPHSREVWQWPTVESIVADTKFALRRLRQSPAFALTVLLTLATGIGANTAVFSVATAAMAASFAPARRAASVNPVQALRSE
jgi:ABC-type antimicrobial peptide transport system permease subunit